MLDRLGEFEAAIPIPERAVERAPGSEAGWRYLGLAYEGTGRTEDARRSYERALELLPGQPMALERLRVLDG